MTGHVLHHATRVVINIVALPPNAQTDHMKVGQRMIDTTVAAGVSSADGSYSLRLSRAKLRPYANPGGIVNMQAFAADGHSFSAYGFSVNIDRPVPAVTIRATRLWPAASRQGFPAVRSFLARSAAGSALARSAAGAAVPLIGCSTPQLITIYSQQWAKVGQTSINITGGETQQFTYVKGQSSSLGIAYASNDYSESGTESKSTNQTIPFDQYGDNATYNYDSEFRYGLYDTGECGDMTGPYDYWGGGKVVSAKTISATYCASYPGGTSPVFNTTTAASFGLGIPVPALGVTLSAQTGWDSSGFITYGMGPNKHNVCGHSGPPGDNPGWLVMN